MRRRGDREAYDMSLYRLFVYGTLKQGQPNHYLLRETKGVARLLGTARLTEKHPMIMTEYGIPILLAKKGEGKIVEGELYEIDETTLAEADELERHPDLYTRTLTHCHIVTPAPQSHASQNVPVTSVGDAVECHIYVFYDYTDEALGKPHLDTYDCAMLPEGMTFIPSNQRSKELVIAIHESLRKIKRNIDMQ